MHPRRYRKPVTRRAILEENRELVLTDAAHCARAIHAPLQLHCHLADGFVTYLAAEQVVDFLDFVEIQVEQAVAKRRVRDWLQRPIDQLLDFPPIDDPVFGVAWPSRGIGRPAGGS